MFVCSWPTKLVVRILGISRSKEAGQTYMGDSSTIIAQMHKMEPPKSFRFAKDKFMVKIYPYVDYAFAATLIAIVEDMKSSDAVKDDDDDDEVIGDVAESIEGTIGSQFIAPYPFEVIIVTNSSGDHLITDVNHKILFKVKPCNTTYHQQRMLLDADDTPIVTMREKHKLKIVLGCRYTKSFRFVKDKFMVKIYPFVDYAFVVTLIAILEAMKSDDEVIGDVAEYCKYWY
ncbi:hypothetical protein L1987_77583 [Smallanthus sonchifolius]|uniref:Uncharacterized protein n=1 Tax=Smallanthus sonchifolius TaxID=185202 RepID=A0ACB8ZET5_9ASTR|nr:hypothetical protein L1987_77583 [Smallanthus sonchifolius]